MTESKQIKLTLVKSRFGRLKSHKDCISGLGLRKIRQAVVVENTPENRGMINKAIHLLEVY